jgi:endonuclease/exonuclease/phosphatase (EEP) superfamily protein YafD
MDNAFSTLPNRPRPAGRGRQLLTLCCWAYLAGVLSVWLVLQWADAWWPATLLMFAPRWAFALPLAVLVPAALLLRFRSLPVLLVAALLVGGPVMGFNVPWPRLIRPVAAGTPFRVMTLNMHYSHADPKALEEFVAHAEPAIVVVQEWPESDRSVLRTTPGWHIHATPRQFLASRYRIERVAELGHHSMGEHACAIRYELATPAGPVHVLSVHTATNRQGITDTIHDNRKGPAEIRHNSAIRREQSVYIAGQAAECRGPVLITGDFNTPPESRIFRQVWDGYTDAFGAAGWGWGYTFFGSRTMVRIDHILMGKEWSCAACRVGPYVGSPHRPVIADLFWNGVNTPDDAPGIGER